LKEQHNPPCQTRECGNCL